VPIAVTGSIATDFLMTFAGRFSEQLVPEQLHRVSLSFLIEDMEVRRGGVAANISFGLGQLGLRPILVGAVGPDFDDYRSWLDRHGVDTDSIRVSDRHFTARFMCTTDLDQNQIASFYAGAMADARDIELGPIAERVGGLDLVVISPNDPTAMQRHTDECRERGIPFLADPSQQLARVEGDEIKPLIEGARYLIANDYEAALIKEKAGWGYDELLAQAEILVTTHGAKGCVIERKGEPVIEVASVPPANIADPTGVGDAFRSGFLAGQTWGLDLERSAQVGSLLATMCLEGVGPQEYDLDNPTFLQRLSSAYGDDASAAVEGFLPA
jgi:adenosine kinase